MRGDFKRNKKKVKRDFEEFVRKESEEYEAYIRQMNREWDTIVRSTNRDWGDFSRDSRTRFLARFEQGEITLETRLEEGENPDDAAVVQRLREQYNRMVTEARSDFKGKKDAVTESLDGVQVKKSLDRSYIRASLRSPDRYRKSPRYSVDKYRARSGQKRRKLSLKLAMLSNHLQKRAKLYLPLVQKYAKRNHMEVPLVLAIMQAESYFNPRARSRDSSGRSLAFGLMQLVPYSGAKEAHDEVHGYPRVVPGTELLNPERNIQLGTAYLSRLRNRYFRGVRDMDKARLLIIAAYNTGPNNVAKAFVRGKRIRSRLKKAVPIINSMSPRQVYDAMKSRLPYAETRKYLPKVVKFMAAYSGYPG